MLQRSFLLTSTHLTVLCLRPAVLHTQCRRASQASDDGQQWTRFQFDSGQLPDHEDVMEFDVKELPGNAAQVDVSHEVSIWQYWLAPLWHS